MSNTSITTDKILDLRGIAYAGLADTEQCLVSNYAVDGDGGGGIFVWSASSAIADDGGTIINPTGNTGAGRWLRQYSGGINLLWYGWIADGATDNSTAFLAGLNTCRTLNNKGLHAVLLVPPGRARIHYARGQSNTNPFDNSTLAAKSFYSFNMGSNTQTQWNVAATAGENQTPAQAGFSIEGIGRAVILTDGDANSWFFSVNLANALISEFASINIKNVVFEAYSATTVTHGLAFDGLLYFNHFDITTYNYQLGVGMWYRRVERGTLTNRTSQSCQRGLVLGDPTSTNWNSTTCNEMTSINDVIAYCGTNVSQAQFPQMGFFESWQSQKCRFLTSSWKENFDACLIVGAYGLKISDMYFEYNGFGTNGALSGYSGLVGGSGYINGEQASIYRSDVNVAICSATLTVAGGVITSIALTGVYPGSNFGFIQGGACYVVGSSSGAQNATLHASVSGIGETVGLNVDVMINPILAGSAFSNPNGYALISDLVFENTKFQHGFLVRASAANQINGVTFAQVELQQEAGGSSVNDFCSFKYVNGEPAYMRGFWVQGWSNAAPYAKGYPGQIAVNSSTYAAISETVAGVLPFAGFRQDFLRFGLSPVLKGSCVIANLSTRITNVTGDGTSYPIVFNNEVCDDNGDYNSSTGVFTAPISGRYQFSVTVMVEGLIAANTSMQLNYYVNGSISRTLVELSPFPVSVSGNYVCSAALLDQRTAGDNSAFQLVVSGDSVKNAGLTNSTVQINLY